MSLSSAEATSLFIRCDSCGQRTDKAVAWLVSKNDMPCGACGVSIDLKRPDNRLFIEETAKHCARMDAALGKID